MKNSDKKRSRCSLALAIGAIVSILLIGLGSAVTYYTYETQKTKSLATTTQIFDFSSLQTEEKLQVLINSVQRFVAISSTLEELGLSTESTFVTLLPYFHQSFQNIPWMDSFFVGYENGSFEFVQAIRDSDRIRTTFSAPEKAQYVIKTIFPGKDGKQQVQLQYFDSSLSRISSTTKAFAGFDPRKRPWYKEAAGSSKTVITNPYVFFTSGQVGITIARSLNKGKGVVGADSNISSISDLLQKQRLTPSTEIFLTHIGGKLLFSSSSSINKKIEEIRKKNITALITVEEMNDPLISALHKAFGNKQIEVGQIITATGRQWFGHVRQLKNSNNGEIFLTIASPLDELMVDARNTMQRNLLMMLSAICIAVGIGLFMSRYIAGSLHKLSVQAEGIRNFKLDRQITVQSRICEVDDLAGTMTVMQSAISRFVEIARALSAEKDMEQVLEMIVSEAQSVTGADGGAIGLVSDDEKTFSWVLVKNSRSGVHQGGTSGIKVETAELELQNANPSDSLDLSVITSKKVRFIHDASSSAPELCEGTCRLYQKKDYTCTSLLMIPLLNRQDEILGILQLVNARDPLTDEVTAFPAHKISYVQALSSNAALALDNNRLIRAQKELFDSFVRLIAGAIDTKSPYTGGHCQRVPIIAGLLADAATSSQTEALQDFSLSESKKYELFVASWLHDCGKVTTPEYVVDKATKLETIYNRIHEIRARFEILFRDTDIDYYKGLIGNPQKEKELQQIRTERQSQLIDDFTFIAQCNVGGEFMSADKIARLQKIGDRVWLRNFDDCIGLSGDEMSRRNMTKKVKLPVEETLLADKEEHIFPRLDGGNPYGDNPWNIVMPVPGFNYNQGERYNLAITKGTLTEEERYKINDHIVQTIEMLNKPPFPKEIRRVPDWAGNHHEKLDGTGYPRALTADQLSVPERIMAVADIFEALTAADRPYNTPKKLSKCIEIMSFMRNDGHICPDLFSLLLTSGIYKEYAAEHMKAEQIDEVDITKYL